MNTKSTLGALIVGVAALFSLIGEQGSQAAPPAQSTPSIPSPQSTVLPTLDPRTPTTTPYPTAPPQGTPGSGRMFDDVAFDDVWRRTDWPVLTGVVKRGFFWGPGVLTENLVEEYREGWEGRRHVQYFDKSRMEINNLGANRKDPFYVTNGLLSVELITGEMQVGNNEFRFRWPAEIPLASDSDDLFSPTYASFRGAYARKDDAQFMDKVVTAQIFRNGSLDFEHGGEGFANLDRFGVRNVRYVPETGHNIPNVFWDFLNQKGPVFHSDSPTGVRTETLIQPWFYATGFPITDAFWTSAKIEGNAGTWVLVQPFQRRVLTYVPSAPDGFKVQMGNIGQHYYEWRYNNAGKSAALVGKCPENPTLGFGKLYFSSDRIRTDLGCQIGAEFRATMRHQRFEGGEMVGVVTYNFYSGRYYEDVFALFRGGTTAKTYPFLPENNAAPAPIPPSKHPVPPNFAAALRSDAETARRFGQATAPVETNVYDPETKTGGAPVQFFDGGVMVYPNPAEKKIYILRNASGYAYKHQGPHVRHTQADRWAVYDDKLTP